MPSFIHSYNMGSPSPLWSINCCMQTPWRLRPVLATGSLAAGVGEEVEVGSLIAAWSSPLPLPPPWCWRCCHGVIGLSALCLCKIIGSSTARPTASTAAMTAQARSRSTTVREHLLVHNLAAPNLQTMQRHAKGEGGAGHIHDSSSRTQSVTQHTGMLVSGEKGGWLVTDRDRCRWDIHACRCLQAAGRPA